MMSSARISSTLEGQPLTGEPIYAIRYQKNGVLFDSEETPHCTFLVQDEGHWHRLMESDAYQAARAFVRSEFDVAGDLVEAVKVCRARFARQSRPTLHTVAEYFWHNVRRRISGATSARDIQFHYDRSNEFYSAFLDERMVYSCAYFHSPEDTLEAAQSAKLDHICRKLDLRDGERFLDIGCGWGALLLHAAERYGVTSAGCTLSSEQRVWGTRQCKLREVADRVTIFEEDYTKLTGKFDKIASVGMFEHVGLKPLQRYFNKVSSLLAAGGRFLNHGIIRPSVQKTNPETLFLTKEVFPGGELVRLIDVIRAAELAGFEVMDVENLRPHYALTCRAWVSRLQKNRSRCLQSVDTETYRTWLLYLAASAASFETGESELHQVLLTKRGESRPLTRDYIYSGTAVRVEVERDPAARHIVSESQGFKN